MKKRFLTIVMAVFICLFSLVLIGCGETADDGNGGGGGSQNQGGNGGTSGRTKKTVVTFCSWNFGTEEENNLTRRRIEAFNKASSTIRIEMVVPVAGDDYDTFLATMASSGALPDVFFVNSVPTAVINQWAMDITDLAKADSEWEDIPVALRDSITYNNKIYAVPAGQYYMGLFANLELIDDYLTGDKSAEEMFAPGAFTTEQWISVVKSMKDINHMDGTGVIGMNAVGDMLNWLPATFDTTGKTKHFTWNGHEFDFRSEALLDALRVITDLGDPQSQYIYDAIPATVGEGDDAEEYRSLILGPGTASDVFIAGRMGFIQEGSWAGTYENVDFDCTFTTYPDGKVIAATDFVCISKSTAHAEAAYEVAKYLTFGAEGAQAMFDILDNNPDANLSLTCIPLNTVPEISSKWFSYIKMKGLQETFEAVNQGKAEVIVEGNKTVPGFLKARYTFNTGISIEGVRDNALLTIGDFLWDTCGGKISISDYITYMTKEVNDAINQLVADDFASMGLEY